MKRDALQTIYDHIGSRTKVKTVYASAGDDFLDAIDTLAPHLSYDDIKSWTYPDFRYLARRSAQDMLEVIQDKLNALEPRIAAMVTSADTLRDLADDLEADRHFESVQDQGAELLRDINRLKKCIEVW